jgi:hypothetical protein
MGLPSQVISVWQVFPYVALTIFFLLLQRIKLCLLISYIFTYYLAFVTYWGELIANAKSMAPFFIYTMCGLAIVVLFVAASFTEKPGQGKPATIAPAESDIGPPSSKS